MQTVTEAVPMPGLRIPFSEALSLLLNEETEQAPS